MAINNIDNAIASFVFISSVPWCQISLLMIRQHVFVWIGWRVASL